jgi:hypothetical protein
MLDRASFPPADLGTRSLPVDTFAPGEVFYRIHRTTLGAKFFGRTGQWRFDSPSLVFGTLYAATSAEIAFAETLLRGQSTLVSEDELRIRSLCRFTLVKPLRLVKLHGPSMVSIGASAAVTSGSYGLSQAWAQALHDHGDLPDGILYRSTTDNDRVAVAIFERADGALGHGASTPLLDDPVRLGAMLDRYGASLR